MSLHSNKARVIAFYLPQYHPTDLNSRHYGENFTEWDNVRAAKKLFPEHDWPIAPGELGYYDLLDPTVREAQAELARSHGIEGFCYYHYWFGNGRMELEKPFQEVLQSETPDFPFCLCWANQPWHKKFWSRDGSSRNELLVDQVYPGIADIDAHFYYCLPAFQDSRYIRVDDKPVFMIYRALEYPDAAKFMARWQQLAQENGLSGIFFIGQTTRLDLESEQLRSLGLDGINTVRLFDYYRFGQNRLQRQWRKFNWWLKRTPRIVPYREASRCFVSAEDQANDIYPSIIPNWDHSPRSGLGGTVLYGSTPDLFREHVQEVVETVANKPGEHRLVFVKSWNEWGEGNYLEPDQRHGRAYLEMMAEALS